jgi:hypothetical protein
MALQRSKFFIVKKPRADEIRLWAKHFAPINDNDAVVNIPKSWSGFFTKSLLTPDHFSWARNFLLSKFWDILQ